MDTTDKPREILIHQSANRPNLLLGGDRELVLVMVMIAGGLAFSLASWWGIGLAAALWVGSMGALQRMGKADPLFASRLPSAHSIRGVLSREERAPRTHYRNTEWMEIGGCRLRNIVHEREDLPTCCCHSP